MDRDRQRESLPAHKLQFINTLTVLKCDPELHAQLNELVNYEEVAFTDKVDTAYGTVRTLGRRRTTVGWGSYNARSVYGREQAINEIMNRKNIGFVGIQEANVRPGRPTLFNSAFARYGANGLKGLLWVVHPDYAAVTVDLTNEMPSGTHPNILWIRTPLGNVDWYAATVYLPNDTKETRETIKTLMLDIDQIPVGSNIIILGDMNGDPFQRKGTNKSILPLLFSDPRLALVPRPNDQSFSRPASRSHLDNIVVSQCLIAKIVDEMEYINVVAEKKTDSDHLMILTATRIEGKSRRNLSGFRKQYNTLALREGRSTEYKIALRTLAMHWTQWAKDTRAHLLANAIPSSTQIITAAYAGLIMTIQSASHQTLGVRRVPTRPKARINASRANQISVVEDCQSQFGHEDRQATAVG